MIKTNFTHDALAWEKVNNMMPAIVQDANTLQVLMLGYMNPEALKTTLASGLVTFFSRGKQRLWTKGETSNHHLHVTEIIADCDQDSLLVLVNPVGPCCHRYTPSCFGEADAPGVGLLAKLATMIAQRDKQRPAGSYVTQLLANGIKRMAQKVGEEGVEVALAATIADRDEIMNEAADLLFHLLVLLQASRVPLSLVLAELSRRQAKK